MDEFFLVILWWVVAIMAVGLGGFVGGRISLRLFGRSLRRDYLELEYRLDDLEQRFSRNMKVQAGVERQRGKRFEDEVLEAAKTAPAAAPNQQKLDWRQWYQQKMKQAP